LAKKNKDKVKAKQPKAAPPSKGKAAPPKAAPKASVKPEPKVAKAPEKVAPAAVPAVVPAKPVVPQRPPGKPTLGVAAPRPRFALQAPRAPSSAGAPAPGAPGAPKPAGRLQARQPLGADELKAKIGALATAIQQIRALKRSVSRSFWDVGTILGDIRDRRLFEAKGYGSFDAFVEREIELGKTVSLRLARVTQVLVREAAQAAGMDRAMAAVAALDGESDPSVPAGTSTSTGLARSPIPVHKL
jgi:hypothetical protein